MNYLCNLSWIKTSERNVLKAHTEFILNIKPLKKVFRKGKMMKIFEYINTLYYKNNFRAIERIQTQLFQDMPKFYQIHYNKYNELISYCQYLLDSRHLDIVSKKEYGNNLIKTLDKVHELGSCIEKQILIICVF